MEQNWKEKAWKTFSVHWKTWEAFLINNIIQQTFISTHLPVTSSYQNSFKLSTIFIIMISWLYFKAEAVTGRCSSKIVVLQLNNCAKK